jgi:hypothetical protein
MNEDPREQWRQALAAKAAQQRRQRYRPRRGLQAVKGAGMVRVLPPEATGPHKAGRPSQREG